jgi:hypothetical protein
MLRHWLLTKGKPMIVPNSLSPQEIFRLIKNGDCAVFQFEEWLDDKADYDCLVDWINSKEQITGPVA